MKLILMLIIAFLLVFIIYARYVEPYQLEVKYIFVDDKLDLKILHFSDVHFGINFDLKHLENLVDEMNKQDVDLIVFTGDFFDDRYDGKIEDIVEVLLNLKSQVPKYAIKGNHDYKGKALELYDDVMSRSDFKVLKNEDEIIELKGHRIRFVGSDDYLCGNFNKDYINYLNTSNEELYNILLIHEPDAIDYIKSSQYDLILAGHSHGGQVNLGFGIRGRNRLGSIYQEGLFILNYKTRMYVSGGLGTSGLRLRFRVKPSISVLSI